MRRWLPPLLAAVLVLGTAGVFAFSRLNAAPPDRGPDRPAAADTVAIRRTDLVTAVSVQGTLGYGAPTTFTGRKQGTVTWLPKIGTVVDRGATLYTVDARSVPLLFGHTPFYRELKHGVTPGPDVRELIDNLRALDYRDPGTDDVFSSATEAAVKRWQTNLGLPDTGTLAAGDVVVLPGKVRIDSVTAQLGAPADAELFAYTSVAKRVSATLDPEQVDVSVLKPGTKVALTLPDGAETAGTVTAITTGASADSGAANGATGGDDPPKRIATIKINNQRTVAGATSGQVQIKVVTATRRNVLAVPVGALLALSEGGYALQVVPAKGQPRLVAVRTGMFAGDLVEVTGVGLTEGMRVVRAS